MPGIIRIKHKPRFVLFIALTAINIFIAIHFPAHVDAVSGEIYRRGIPVVFLTISRFETIIPIAFIGPLSRDLLHTGIIILLMWVIAYCIFKIPDVLKWLEFHLNRIFEPNTDERRITIRYKLRFALFIIFLIINAILTIIFPTRIDATPGFRYEYHYGFTNTFLIIHRFVNGPPRPLISRFGLDLLQFTINILEMWLIAFFVFKISAVFRKITNRLKQRDEEDICKGITDAD